MLDERRFYDRIQRDFPLDERPYRTLAERVGCNEQALLGLFARDFGAGRINRIGAVFAPNQIGVSTLAALAVAPEQIDRIAQIVSAHPAVSHNYARDGHRYNLWFVAGARDRWTLNRVLAHIGSQVKQTPLDLPLQREFHIDLGFTLSVPSHRRPRHATTPTKPRQQPASLDPSDWQLIAALEEGLKLTPRPYRELAQRSGLSSERVMTRLAQWQESGLIRRFGAVLHHRQFGYARNLMCVWNCTDAQADAFGAHLAGLAPVSLCYRRARHLPEWPYNMYVMVHARDTCERERALELITREAAAPDLALPSRTCYVQRGTRYATPYVTPLEVPV